MFSFKECTLAKSDKTFAQEINEHNHPIYGAYVIGREWCFIILQKKNYAISEPYIATKDDIFDIFDIFRILTLQRHLQGKTNDFRRL